VFTCAQVNATFQPDYTEPDEGRLVRVNGVSYNPTAGTITDQTGTAKFYAAFEIPYSQFDLIGILKQFKATTSPPFTQDYEIQARFEQDILPHPGPVMVATPSEDSIKSDAVRIRWTTDVPSTSVVLFGETSLYTDSSLDASLTTEHAVWLTGLTPATFYHYAVASEDSNGRTSVSGFLFSTASLAGTTGAINVYFNKEVNTSVSLGENASGGENLLSRLVQRIDNARRSVDAAFYNLSGSAGASIASALVRARERGLPVRVIGEADNQGNAPFSTIASNGIPFITDEFDAVTNGAGLMHDKFAIIDGRGGAPESVWVWTGSWNPSDPGTNNDRQNSIEIQDVALARTYLAEFNEMWGSPTQSANASLSRVGSRKLDDTPHRFNVNGTPIECYFSPSDRTTLALGRALSRAEYSVCEAMYTFTRRDLADTLIALKQRGRKVRVVMDNNSDTGTQFSVLVSAGVDVHLKGFDVGLLHHKYALVDATNPAGPQWTITGSHNWSTSAENSNNENTLIIRNTRVTNLYLQEFYARYLEAGGVDPIVLGVRETGGTLPAEFVLHQNYPNPFNPHSVIRYSLPVGGFVSLKVYDILGREVTRIVDEHQQAGNYEITLDASGLASGMYVYALSCGNFSAVRKMMIMK
jgi:phosphatidylserine/phosphatidylglycerophosphate/cardiolipin synthase-like enzyme